MLCRRQGNRIISDLLDISRNTVKKYITIFNMSGKPIEETLAKNEPDLLRIFNEKPVPYPILPSSSRAGMGTQEGLQHFHVEGLPKYLVEVD